MDLESSTRRLTTGLTRVAVAVAAAEGTPAAGLERTLTQQQVLLVLSRRAGAYPLIDLAADLGMSVPDTVVAISTLAREGLATMDPSPSFAPREVRVTLTEAGRAQPAEPLNWAAELLGDLHEIDQDGQHQLLGVVTGQIRRMQRDGEIPVTKMCVTCRFFDGYAHASLAEPHHCWLVDAAFGHGDLRVRCPEASPGQGPTRPDPTRPAPPRP